MEHYLQHLELKNGDDKTIGMYRYRTDKTRKKLSHLIEDIKKLDLTHLEIYKNIEFLYKEIKVGAWTKPVLTAPNTASYAAVFLPQYLANGHIDFKFDTFYKVTTLNNKGVEYCNSVANYLEKKKVTICGT